MNKVIEVGNIQEGDNGKRIVVKTNYPKVIECEDTINSVNEMVENNETLVIYEDNSFIEIVSDDSADILIQRGLKYIE